MARIHAGLPGWGTYALLYTTALVDHRVTATLAVTGPADLDPRLGLNSPRPYAEADAERRSPWEWASAAETPKSASESQPAYERRLATYLVRTGHAARLSPGSLDLPHASWQVDVDQFLTLTTPRGGTGYAGHHQVQIGRLIHLTPNDQTRKEPAP